MAPSPVPASSAADHAAALSPLAHRHLPPVPVVVAPMAGGPSTPELVAAVVRAGGGGLLAGGMRTAEQMRAQVDRVRELLDAPVDPAARGRHGTAAQWRERFGVNLFVPDAANTAVPEEARTPAARAARAGAVAAYRERLAPLAAELDAALPTVEEATPTPEDEAAAFEAMLQAAVDQAWPLVSFTFGLPSPEVFARLAAAGIPAGVTVTDAAEARAAVGNGARFLVVQGPEAGGHRATLDPAADPDDTALPDLLAAVRTAVGPTVPLLAAGGIATIAQVRRLLEAGAAAVSAGTAFLRTPEAGTSVAHREALRRVGAGTAFTRPDDGAAATALTRAFTGRWARSLQTPFMEGFADAPAAYPEVNALTQPLRAAAAGRGDLDHVHLWAGTQAHRAAPVTAAQALASLAPWG